MGNIVIPSDENYWRATFESTWKSKENHVKKGEIREIEGELHRAAAIYRRFILKDIVMWSSLSPSTIRFNFNNNLDLGYLFWLYYDLDIDKLKDDYKKENN